MNNAEHLPFFRSEEILAVSEDHILDTGLKDDGTHWAFLAGAVPPPDSI